MIKVGAQIIFVLIQVLITAYLSLYIFYQIITIQVITLLIPLKIITALLSSLIIFFLSNIIVYRAVSSVKPLKEGKYKLKSNKYKYWEYKASIFNILQSTLNMVPGADTLFFLLCKALGAKIGRNCKITKGSITDPELTKIGENTVVGRDAVIASHVIEKDYLILKKISIGSNCLVSTKSVVLPGTVIENKAIIGINAVILKDSRVKKKEFWGGIPAKKIKKI